MAIVQLPLPIAANTGVKPNIKTMAVTDNLTQLQAAGFLNSVNLQGYPVSVEDELHITYNYNQQTGAGDLIICKVSIANGVITLVPDISEGNVVFPVVNNDFVMFSGTAGQIKDNGFSATDNTKTKVVMVDGAVISGNFASFSDAAGTIKNNNYSPSNAAKTKVAMLENVVTTGNLAQFSDVNGTVANTSIASNRVLVSAFNNPSVNANLIYFDITVTAAALAAGGSVTLVASSGAIQYKIRELYLNASGGMSGGGGNRDVAITDNTTNYSVIPTAVVGTPVNGRWGGAQVPFPLGSLSLSTVAGAPIVAKYFGGAADFAAGDILISGYVERIA